MYSHDFRVVISDESGPNEPVEVAELDCWADYDLGPDGRIEIARVGVYFGSDRPEIGSRCILWHAIMSAAEGQIAANSPALDDIEAALLDEVKECNFPSGGLTHAQGQWLRDLTEVPFVPIWL